MRKVVDHTVGTVDSPARLCQQDWSSRSAQGGFDAENERSK